MSTLNVFNNLEANYVSLSVATMIFYLIITTILFPKKVFDSAFDVAGIAFVYYVAGLVYNGKNGVFKYFSTIIEKYQMEGASILVPSVIFIGLLIAIVILTKIVNIFRKNPNADLEIFGILRLGLFFAILDISFFGNAINYVFFIPFYALVGYSAMEYDAIEKVAKSNKI